MFSRYAHEEAEQKCYGKRFRKKQALSLAAALIDHTLQEAYGSHLPVLQFFTDQQQGDTFGERFCEAIESGFNAGYQRLIICGTDTPDLKSEQFAAVALKLNTHQIVLGPSADGGVYMIGIHKQAFDKKDFLQISWLTSSVCDQLIDYAHKKTCSLSLEATAIDIDDSKAVWHCMAIPKNNWFVLFIRHLLQTPPVTYTFNRIYPICQLPLSSLSRRGPPQVH